MLLAKSCPFHMGNCFTSFLGHSYGYSIFTMENFYRINDALLNKLPFWLCPWTITCISNTYGFIDKMNAVILVIKHLQIIQIFMIVCLYKVAQICSSSKEGCSFLRKRSKVVRFKTVQILKLLLQ